jgi:hypothetical protein
MMVNPAFLEAEPAEVRVNAPSKFDDVADIKFLMHPFFSG